jgi:hypothetical protein
LTDKLLLALAITLLALTIAAVILYVAGVVPKTTGPSPPRPSAGVVLPDVSLEARNFF